MKRMTTKEILAESFRELAEKKPVDKITIKDITDNCGYSPATFYRQFKDKHDLIAWEYASHVSGIMKKVGDNYRWKQAMLDGAAFLEERKAYLTNLFLHTSGHDAFIRYMTESYCDSLEFFIKNESGKAMDEKMEMCIRLYSSGTCTLICEWILGKHAMTKEDLVSIFEISLPFVLRQYLV